MARCQVVTFEVDGEVVSAHYQGEPTDDPETLRAIEAVARRAYELLKEPQDD